MGQGLSTQRLRQHFAALRFLYGKTLGRPAETAFLSWPKDIEKLPVVLSEEQVHRLLDALEKPRFRVFFTTMYAAGLRISETCRVQTGDIDAARGVIHVRGKGGKERLVMLSPRLLVILRAYWKHARPPAPWLFTGRRTTHRSRGRPQRAGQGLLRSQPRQEGHPACAAPQLRDAPARSGHRLASHPGLARPWQHSLDHAVHARLGGRDHQDQEPAGALAQDGLTLDASPSGTRPADTVRHRGHRARASRRARSRNLLVARTAAGALGHRALPHRRARWPSRPVPLLSLIHISEPTRPY